MIVRARCWFSIAALTAASALAAPVELGNRLELFVDHHLVEQFDHTSLQLGRPQPQEVVLRFDAPWEKAANYVTVIKDGATYRMYYRGCAMAPSGDFDSASEATCYAESVDGVHWVKPDLGLHEFQGSRHNNILLPPDARRVSHNFSPYLDARPGVPADERFKAVGGVFNDNGGAVPAGEAAKAGGLFRYVSGDGLHWRLASSEPLFPGYALDSLNCLTWVAAEGQYAIYLRTWSEGGTPKHPAFRGYRTVSRSTSKDFVTWTKPERMDFGDTPPENLYTNGTHAYFRSPELLVGLAFRFWPERSVLSEEEMTQYGVHPTQQKGMSDAVLLTSRGGRHYDRTFLESMIRPGLDRHNWSARNNAPALGVVPTGEGEMSLYLVTHYTQPDCQLRRFTLRTDGFASLHAGYDTGKAITRPLTFTGAKLVLNYSTSAAGSLKIEILDEVGNPLPGFAVQDCVELIGDELGRVVTWRGQSDLSALAGRAVRLRFTLKDADVYSLQFSS